MSFFTQWWRGSVQPTEETPPNHEAQSTDQKGGGGKGGGGGEGTRVTAEQETRKTLQARTPTPDGTRGSGKVEEERTERHQQQKGCEGCEGCVEVSRRADPSLLPRLPFTYVPSQAVLLLSTHPVWPYAGLVTDLDVQLLRYLHQRSVETEGLYYQDQSFSDLFVACVFSERPEDLATWTRLLSTRDLYQGVFNVRLMEVLSHLDCGSDEVGEEITHLLEQCQAHWQAWYGETGGRLH